MAVCTEPIRIADTAARRSSVTRSPRQDAIGGAILSMEERFLSAMRTVHGQPKKIMIGAFGSHGQMEKPL